METGGVTGVVGGTLAGTMTESNVVNTAFTISTSLVGGQLLHAWRLAYTSSLNALGGVVLSARAAGASPAAAAQFANAGRNALKDAFRPFAPLWGNYHKPTYEALRATKTDQQIIDGALRSNSGVDWMLGVP